MLICRRVRIDKLTGCQAAYGPRSSCVCTIHLPPPGVDGASLRYYIALRDIATVASALPFQVELPLPLAGKAQATSSCSLGCAVAIDEARPGCTPCDARSGRHRWRSDLRRAACWSLSACTAWGSSGPQLPTRLILWRISPRANSPRGMSQFVPRRRLAGRWGVAAPTGRSSKCQGPSSDAGRITSI